MTQATVVGELVQKNQQQILDQWLTLQLSAITSRADQMREPELREQSREFLQHFGAAISADSQSVDSAAWKPVKDVLAGICRSRAAQGYTPSETATFVFSLKQPIFELLRRDGRGGSGAEELWAVSTLLDRLGLYTTEVYQQSRESVIKRQQEELLELSTPVVELWRNIVALPLIGTLDSARTQVVMESLLEKIVEREAMIAIIDITGVPTVDTLVAQHLLKTVAAARLMGADCIISGMRPQIAQTIVHLGVNLSDVITKATLADAFSVALQRTGAAIVRNGARV